MRALALDAADAQPLAVDPAASVQGGVIRRGGRRWHWAAIRCADGYHVSIHRLHLLGMGACLARAANVRDVAQTVELMIGGTSK